MPPASPIERAYGSIDVFAAAIRADVDSGVLDRGDMVGPTGDGGVLRAILNWHSPSQRDLWR